MSIYDPPSDPYGDEKSCPFCDYPLVDKGISNFHDWVCTNPECEHSPCYQDPDEPLKFVKLHDGLDWVPF
jgi:hypothetical protein